MPRAAYCTWFLAHADPVAARKRWIAGTLEPKGAIIIDKGAAEALTRGKSLLPAGVTKIEGSFERGDAVVIRNGEGASSGAALPPTTMRTPAHHRPQER